MEGSNAGLVTDLVRLQLLSDCYQLKKNGDALFAKGGMQVAEFFVHGVFSMGLC